MGTYTPGPWEVADNCYEEYAPHAARFQVDSPQWTVALVLSDVSEIDAEANARLIAAAPDLLAALREIEWQAGLSTVHGGVLNDQWVRDTARAAIAKATGADA